MVLWEVMFVKLVSLLALEQVYSAVRYRLNQSFHLPSSLTFCDASSRACLRVFAAEPPPHPSRLLPIRDPSESP